MSTATLERVALPDGFTESVFELHSRERSGWDRRYTATLTRGATGWRVDFLFSTGPLHERLVLDGQPFHRPVVQIHKRTGHREAPVFRDDAPLYVQKFIEQHIMDVAAFEQQRHGVPPMTMTEYRRWEAAEEAARQRRAAAEAANKRELVQMMARDVREVAQCGTANSEAIAAWILDNFTGNGAVEDMQDEHRDMLAEIAAERENEHAEIIEELNQAIDIAQRGQDAIGSMDFALDLLKLPSPLEFAYGATETEKVLDVLSSGVDAIAEYQHNYSNSDIPEKRKES